MHVIKLLISKVLRTFYWIGLFGAVIITIFIIVLYIIDPHWLAADSCVDMGNVWDDEQNSCIIGKELTIK